MYLDRNYCIFQVKMEKQIDEHFRKLFEKARLLLSENNSSEVASALEKSVLNFEVITDKYSRLITLMTNLKNECQDKAVEIREELDLKEKYEAKNENKFSFVFQGRYKNMSWGDIADLEDRCDSAISDAKEAENILEQPPSQLPWKKITSIDGADLPKEISIRMVSRLDNLPPAFGWYSGDKKHKAGIYIRLPENMFIRVPFPNVIDGTQNYTRNKTIKCKYETEDQCLESRKFLSERYNTEIRNCLFAHKGDVYSKVGTNFRCPSNPRFGSHEGFKSDVEALKSDDIKPVLMYALSDLLACFVWNDYHHSNDRIVFSDIEVCQ